jgi:nucleoid-associated protein YgaU
MGYRIRSDQEQPTSISGMAVDVGSALAPANRESETAFLRQDIPPPAATLVNAATPDASSQPEDIIVGLNLALPEAEVEAPASAPAGELSLAGGLIAAPVSSPTSATTANPIPVGSLEETNSFPFDQETGETRQSLPPPPPLPQPGSLPASSPANPEEGGVARLLRNYSQEVTEPSGQQDDNFWEDELSASTPTRTPTSPAVTLDRRENAATGESPNNPIRSYVVRSGDTLSDIASRELGSLALANNIYLLNRDIIPNPDQLSIGMRLRLPPQDAPIGGLTPEYASTANPGGTGFPATGAADSPAREDDPDNPRIYQVRPGDTLSSIARRFYGSTDTWRFLYEHNRANIASPNRLTVGTELLIPPYDNIR